MFRHRRNSQKPTTELYDCFKKSYPSLGPSSASPTFPITSPESEEPLTETAKAPTMASSTQYPDQEHHEVHDGAFHENENWRLTPSILDVNSFNFSHFPNHESSDLMPASHGMEALFHSRAGDLHTPNFSFPLGTPLSSGQQAFDPQRFHSQSLQHPAFGGQDNLHYQTAFAPSAFVHRDSGYGTLSTDHGTPSSRKVGSESDAQEIAQYSRTHGSLPGKAAQQLGSTKENFRYYATLNAPTAMVKHADEIPITYLNKGQAYAISINDTMGNRMSPVPSRYRTVIRVSFEDEEQRLRPGTCWQLWKEGRGTAESHQRGGRLQAVEFVDPSQQDNENTQCQPRIDLEMASFDSFAVNWSPLPGSSDINIAVRFNFLSTDFSHSKGVKGIPVRLCAKTELISSGTPESPPGPTAEVSFCKVKLFRDHGAERKLSNDIAHIKKNIDKLQQQIAQIEIGLKDGSKRKRSDTKPAGQRPSKVAKHKRTSSVSSQNSNDRPVVDEDLSTRLSVLQDMFTSTRPVSVLHLRGEDQDDPDAYPVILPGDQLNPADIPKLPRGESWETSRPSAQSTPTKILSPTSTTHTAPLAGQAQPAQQALRRPSGPYEPRPQAHHQPDWESFEPFPAANVPPGLTTTRVARQASEGTIPTWIEASGVDQSYQPLPEPIAKPVACFYALFKDTLDGPQHDHHKAVYLMERTRDCLIKSMCAKFDVDASCVKQALRLNPKGLKIQLDDDVVGQIPEGQDMTVEFVASDAAVKQETTDRPSAEVDTSLELRLVF